jgi:hypothetical protein
LIEEEKVKAVVDLEKFREQNLKAEGEKETLMITNKSLEEAKLLVDDSLKVERKELTDEISSLRLIIGEGENRCKLIEEEKLKSVMERDILLAELREQNLEAEKETETSMFNNKALERENTRPTQKKSILKMKILTAYDRHLERKS